VIIVADSGSTNTVWYYSSPEIKGTVQTSGLHPDNLDSFSPNDYEQIMSLMNKSGKLYFYGSGCATKARQETTFNWLKERFPLFDIVVQSDLIASGLVLYGSQQGIVGILGTGASMAVWRDQTMKMPIPSLGWAIGDEGSGVDIASRFFKNWYSGKFPDSLVKLLDSNDNLPNAIDLISDVYSSKQPNKIIASFCNEISKLTTFDSVRRIVQQAFHDYFDYYSNLLLSNKDLPIAFTGGVANGFKPILTAVAKARGYDIFSIIENPIKKLAAYHIASYSDLSNSF
jgi:N-acetylglucosamine kinase-like BadF-type ATPase